MFPLSRIVVRTLSILACALLLSFTSNNAHAQACPCSIWSDAATPGNAAVTDNQPIEIGLKFRSDVNGFVSAIRFYKGALNTGVHVGHLWSSAGTLLAEATFSGETASGWQQVTVSPAVPITANTTYIVSYHSASGYFTINHNFFLTQGVNNPPVHALQAGIDGANGVFKYGVSGFPSSGDSNNYWVDVVFETQVGPDLTPPAVTTTTPTNGANDVSIAANVSATFSEAINPATMTSQTFKLRGPGGIPVSAALSYSQATGKATLDPGGGFAPQTVYTATITGGPGGVKDLAGNSLSADLGWSFTTSVAPSAPPNEGPGGPVLILSTTGNPFSRYLTEIVRAEGFNSFTTMDVLLLTPAVLASVDVAVLGEMALTPEQATMLSDFVVGGGGLIAMRPDASLYGLLGLQNTTSTLSDRYLLVDTASTPGAGIVGETMQFHGTADRYTIADGNTQVLATLYSDANTATSNPAVTIRSVGSNGGRAAAFAFDLSRSIVYTRQGNPQWSGQERDGISPIRSNDLFFGAGEPDWVDLSKVAIPQADEQQRLLANLILDASGHRKPLPRFWYFPRGIKAAIVMTGDDHATGGTTGRFEQFRALSAPGCSVADWQCIRGTSYIYNGTPGINNAAASAFTDDGFEIGLHVSTNCADWTPSSLSGFFNAQLAQFAASFPSIPSPVTNRTHCIVWSDYTTQAQVQLAKGIRFDTNYYYFPGPWLQDRPGFMTGSGMPMRFADADGTTIDVYQAATQMTDESMQSYPFTVDTLITRALGPLGYYGAFVANMHTDQPTIVQSDAILASAQARGVPVVTSRQMLEWIDGRNNSSFRSIAWSPGALSFTIEAAAGANGLTAMVPASSASGPVTTVTRNGTASAFTLNTIKGVEYAVFPAMPGNYVVSYAVDDVAPLISGVSATPGAGGTAMITWTTDEPSDSRVTYGLSAGALTGSVSSSMLVSSHNVTLTGLTPLTTYYFRVSSADAVGNLRTSPGAGAAPAQFVTPTLTINLIDTTVADFSAGTLNANVAVTQSANGEVTLAPGAGSEFFGTSLPADWSTAVWNAGGTATVVAGSLAVDGARAGTTADFGPGRSVEFVATFSGAPFQHMGFAVTYDDAPWAIFSTAGGGALFARTANGSTSIDTPVGTNWLGTPRRFRVDWSATSVTYSIDGTVVATHAVAIAANMRPVASDFTPGGGALSVDWVRMTPYATSGVFTSRVFDAGEVVNWGTLSFGSQTPAGTGIAGAVRTGDSATPNSSWTPFNPITSGGSIGATSRYAQYQVTLSSGNSAITPSLDQVTIGFSPNDPPLAANDAYSTDKGMTLVVAAPGVLTNDTDPDQDSLTAVLASGTAHGTLTLNANGSFTYTPHAGFSGSDSFTYAARDGVANSAPATVSITVRAITPFESPADWFSTPWFSGGSATSVSGNITVDGALAGSNAVFGPGRALEFVATFSGDPWQHVGFGIDFNSGPWIIFSTFQGGQLFARIKTESGQTIDTPIPGNWLGEPHQYRIDWHPMNIVFSIDGTIVGTNAVTIGADLRALISDFNAGGGTLNVAHLEVGDAIPNLDLADAAAPAGWSSGAWSAGGGAAAVNGNVTVDGALAGTNAMFGPGRSLEFNATFSGDPWQHAGFGIDCNSGPWIIFSTFQGGQLYARIRTESGQAIDTLIPGNWLGVSHRYRIDWNPVEVVFSIDEIGVAANPVTIGANLRPLISDLNVGGNSLSVASVRLAP